MKAMIGLVAAALAVSLSACGKPAPAATEEPPAKGSGVESTQAPLSNQAAIYVAVVRRYLNSPAENSFPDKFPQVFVLDQALPSAADPHGNDAAGAKPLSAEEKQAISDAIGSQAKVTFVGTRKEALVDKDGCPQTRDGGILLVLAPPVGDDKQVQVGMNGFVACLGATWLTYVVKHDGSEWTVTGTTGASAIS